MNKLTNLLHINYFVALWVLLSTVATYLAGSLPMKLLSELNLDMYPMLGYALIPVLTIVCLIIIWPLRKKLSPITEASYRFKMFAVGHWAILIGHVLIVIPLLYSVWALMYDGKGGHITISALYSAAGLFVALTLYFFGIVCLEILRRRIARKLVSE